MSESTEPARVPATWVNVGFWRLVWFFLKVAIAILPALIVVLLFSAFAVSLITITATVTAK